MKRYTILTVVVLAILVVAWTAFGQEEEGAERRQQPRDLLRQRFENMSEEEQKEFRANMIERYIRSGGLLISPEERQKSIKAIEEQLAKLKATEMPRFEGAFQDLSEDESAKLRKNARKLMRGQMQALQVITNQVARLQGLHLRDGEDAQFFVTSTNRLKQIQDAATKEKAKETSELLGRMITRGTGRGFGGRRRGGNQPQSDQQR